MVRPLRIQYPGAVYHITCRGNARQDIYKDNKDRKAFLEILTDSQKIYSIKIPYWGMWLPYFLVSCIKKLPKYLYKDVKIRYRIDRN